MRGRPPRQLLRRQRRARAPRSRQAPFEVREITLQALCRLERRGRQVGLAELKEHMSEIVVGAGRGRLSFHALAIGTHGLCKRAAHPQRPAEPEPGSREVGPDGKQPPEQPDGRRMLALLRQDLPQAVERVRIAGIELEDLAKAEFGLEATAVPVMYERALERERQAPSVQSPTENSSRPSS